jgi:hypothetical protein
MLIRYEYGQNLEVAMKFFAKRQSAAATRNADKYDSPAVDRRDQSTVTGAVVESFLNPFFVLGRR